jgi:hypothetical protein
MAQFNQCQLPFNISANILYDIVKGSVDRNPARLVLRRDPKWCKSSTLEFYLAPFSQVLQGLSGTAPRTGSNYGSYEFGSIVQSSIVWADIRGLLSLIIRSIA